MQCGAKTKTGSPCKAPAMPNGRCRRHGGKTPSGIAHPNTIHGRYSKDLPTRLADRFAASESDPDLLNLRIEIALLDARVGDLLTRVEQGESGELWGKLKEAVTGLEEMVSLGLPIDGSLAAIKQIISRGMLDFATWREIGLAIEGRRKLVESEQKRRVAMQDMITSERAMVVIATLSDSVRRHVDDPHIRAAIAADLGAILSRNAD